MAKNANHKSFKKEPNLVEDSINKVKETIHDGEDFFADEIEQVKETAKKSVEMAGGYTNQATNWIKENRQTVIGVILIAMGLYRLWSIVLGVLLVIFGVLFVVGYFKDIRSIRSFKPRNK